MPMPRPRCSHENHSSASSRSYLCCRLLRSTSCQPPRGSLRTWGVRNGRFAPCPDKPNCVSTQAGGDEQKIDPLPLRQKPSEAIRDLRETIQGMPRTRIVSEDADYLHAEFTSLLFRFVDDLEIWVDETNQLIHARSASRVGYSDLGSNRKRVEAVFREYQRVRNKASHEE